MKTKRWPLDGEVHLYGLVLPHDPAELARLGGLLSTNETARASLLRSDLIMRRYVAGRGLLREILGGYLGVGAKQVQLAAGDYGKPVLLNDKENLYFNLAHSDDNFLLAIAADREVGIDIEKIDTGKPLAEMAGMVFSRQEQEQLAGLASPCLEEVFFRCWVRREACLKACGKGFSIAAGSFEVAPLDEMVGALIACCDQRYWHIIDIEAPHGFCAALATESCSSTQPPPIVVGIDPFCRNY